MRTTGKICKGNAVEFAGEARPPHHTMGEGEFGIAIEDERADGGVTVELASGVNLYLIPGRVVAYGWGGWLPENLEDAYMRHNPDSDDEGIY